MNTSELTVVCQPLGLNSNSTRAQRHMGAYFSIIHGFLCLEGFPDSSAGKESTCHAGYTGDMGLISGFGKILWRRKWKPTPVSLPGKSHGQRSLVGYSLKDRKESDMTDD